MGLRIFYQPLWILESLRDYRRIVSFHLWKRCRKGVNTVLEERLLPGRHLDIFSLWAAVFMPTKWLSLSICFDFWLDRRYGGKTLGRKEGETPRGDSPNLAVRRRFHHAHIRRRFPSHSSLCQGLVYFGFDYLWHAIEKRSSATHKIFEKFTPSSEHSIPGPRVCVL